ncbi:hypothetical protein MTP02_29670 [Streptomyces albus]|nr:hypothetical protein MTP02_29670 [Streptomyces albus]
MGVVVAAFFLPEPGYLFSRLGAVDGDMPHDVSIEFRDPRRQKSFWRQPSFWILHPFDWVSV